MANTLRIKRRAAGGASGAPSGLENAELAFNEQDDTLYYGKGTGGANGTATQVIAIGGPGAFQPRDTDLDAVAALAANGIIVRTGSGTATTRSITGTAGRIGVTNGDGVSGAPTIDLATSGVTAGTFTKITVDAYGRATVGAQAGLSDLAAPSANFDFNAKRLTNLADPVSAQDAATKNYVDLNAQGLDPKQSVKAASTGNIASLSGTTTIDGVALIAGDRVLVKDQSTAAQNGVYVVAAGAWARADDMSVWTEHISAYLFVEQGTVNADNGFLCTVDAGGTLGSTAVTFVQFNGAGQIIAGAGLTKSGNQIDVAAGTGITVASDNVALDGQALALHNLATNGIFVRTGAGTVAARSVATSGSGISVSNGDAVAGNPTLSLSAALASVGGLTPAADRIAYYTGSAAAALATLTAFGRSLIDDADAAAGRTTLGLGSLATLSSINNSNWSGTALSVGNGGTGATTLTGYIKGSGTSAFTASATIPNTDITGLGTMSTQAASSVAITGGSITNLTTFDGITIDGGTF